MSTKYESYAAGGDTSFQRAGANWDSQTFTPSIAHTITSVKLFMFQFTGFPPGLITVRIRATAAGKPSGGDLCSGTTNGNTLPSIAAGGFQAGAEWREIFFGAGTPLAAGTKYAIVISVAAAACQINATTVGGYAGGDRCVSGDSGATWANNNPQDFYFEEWGTGLTAKAFASFTPKLVAARLI